MESHTRTGNFGEKRERSATVSYLEVEQAAIGLLLGGDKPSIATVRKALGDRGSSQTIHAALKRFWWDLGLKAQGDPAALSRLPIEIAESVESIWQRALALAAQSAKTDENQAREHLERLRIANEVRDHSFTLRETDMETQTRERERALAETRDQLLGTLRSLAKAQEELKSQARRIGALQVQVGEYRNQIAAMAANPPTQRRRVKSTLKPRGVKPRKSPARNKAPPRKAAGVRRARRARR